MLQGNGNLATSGHATVILNEVSGTTRSVLEGALEVHGASADVIVANPNGITCDGCGFINTPRVTLTTGLAEIGATGALSGFAVTGGDVLIGTNGADARATTIFDIVSRRISLQGPVAAGGDLSLIAGQNDFDYGSRSATSRGSDGNAPGIAIDSSLLGGMYAGRISILATEAGSGVNMQGQMAANAGEMTLTADGRLVMGQVQARGPLRATSQSSTVRAERTIFSDEAITLQGLTAVEIAENTLVASQSDVALVGSNISLETGAIVAAGVTSSGAQTTSGSLTLSGTAIDAGEGTLVAGARIALEAATVDLSRENAATADTVRSLGDVDITTGTLTATNGQIRAGDVLTISNSGDVAISGGDFASVSGLDVTADSISANATLNTQGTANLRATVGSVVNEGRVAGDAGANLTAETSITNAGDVLSQTVASLTAGMTITNAATGQVVSAASQLNANAVDNAGLAASQTGALSIASDQSVTNTGTLVGVSALDLTVGGPVINSGDMVAQGAITITGLNNGASGAITNQADGLINGGSVVNLNGASLNNGGAIGAASGALSVDVTGDITNTGLLYSGTSSNYRLDGNFTNTNADVLAEADIAIVGLTGPRAGSVNNVSGTIESVAGNLTITAADITNERPAPTITTSSTSVVTGSNNPPNPGRGDTTSATQTTTTTTVEEAVHSSAPAQMLAGSSITLDATTVTNDYSQIAANRNVTILAGTVTNTGRDLIETTDVRATTYYEQRYCDTRIFGFCIDWDTRRWNTTQTSQTTATVDAEFATIEAGGALTALISGYLDNDAVRDGADQIGLTSGDRALAAADVTALGGDTLSDLTLSIDTVLDRGALFDPASDPNAPYLVETRAEFIDASQYLGSDYFLSQVGGFNPDETMRRFGDAYVETRLIREQIFALTGGRYLAGSLDDLTQMQALYDNAIDAQQALNLTVGVALTPSQIAALTSDIAWLETQIVQGQEVLVPRLYLSQATLANVDLNSARIVGGQTTILAGAIANSGIISSATNLDLTTTTAFSNEGGSLFANADITIDVGSLFANQSGQVVGGGNVAIDAENVLNNTLISRDDMPSGFTDRAQQTARIEAGGNLQINASGVVGAIGGDFASGDNLTVTAGDGIEIGALVLETNREDTINGGYDNAYSRTNTLANIAAGGDLNIATGGDLTIEGGNLNAGGDATLVADGAVNVTSVQDVDQRDLKLNIDSGGLFGVETNIRQQEAEVETQRTVISSGGGLTITANTGDLTIAASTLESGDETRLTAGGEARLLTETDSTFSQDFLREEDLFWWNEGDEGESIETIEMVEIHADGGFTIDAGAGIIIEYEAHANLDEALTTISSQPGLEWMGDMRTNPDVDWNAVQATVEEWDYEQQGLTEAGALLVTAIVTYATGGAGGLVDTLATQVASGLNVAATNVAMNAAIKAGISNLVTQSSVALVNNQGDLAATLEQLGSSDGLRSLATAMVSAGFTAQLTNAAGLGDFDPKTATAMENTVYRAQTGLISASVNATVSTAINGGDIGDNLTAGWTNAMAMAGLAGVQHSIGDFGEANGLPEGSLPKMLAHAVAGGLAAEAAGGSFADGAMAAALAEALGPVVGGSGLSSDRQIELQRLLGTTAILLANDGDAEGAGIAAGIAASAHENNYLNHEETVLRARAKRQLEECQAETISCTDEVFLELQGTIALMDLLDQARDTEYLTACGGMGQLQCLAARSRYIEAQATFMEANSTLGNEGYLSAFGDVFDDVQVEFQSGLAVDRQAMINGVQKGVDFTQRNLNALGGGAAGGALLATAYFGGAAIAQCAANPICRTELSVAIGEAAAGDALAASTLMPVVAVAGKTAIVVGDDVVGFIDEATGAFARSIDVPYDARVIRNALEESYGTDNVLSTTIPPLNKPNVRLANSAVETSAGVNITFNSRGFPVFDDVALFDTRFTAADYRTLSSTAQMRAATQSLNAQIVLDQGLSNRFTSEQLSAIRAGNARIPGLTWHHHEDTGRMQLVAADIHGEIRHIGGDAMWDGR
ncbi:DUF637 domain-containing protein [Yoonia sp. GPGPB17]|uniref:two-partner secretion domain-containing protein n=1 Tax=Yoonia sp. GPGPB17 TaxID=3026147 RepID=UPI0030C1A782